MNPFEELPQYELRHLLHDLEELGRVQDIHLILSLETDNQKNAWFDIKRNTNNENEVVPDFSYALRLLINNGDKDGKNDFPMEFRYALMLSSLNQIYRDMPVPFMKELIKAKAWDTSQLSNVIDNLNILELIPILSAKDIRQLISSEKFKNTQNYSNKYIDDCIIRLLEINDIKTARMVINNFKKLLLLSTRIQYLLSKWANLSSGNSKSAAFLRIVNYWRKSETTTSTKTED